MSSTDLKYQILYQKNNSKAALMTPEDREILKGALEAKDEWAEINSGFELVNDDMLVDYYIYRLKACEARYAYFIKQVKERGLSRYF